MTKTFPFRVVVAVPNYIKDYLCTYTKHGAHYNVESALTMLSDNVLTYELVIRVNNPSEGSFFKGG
jgi:hypothetical protein